MDRFKNPKVTGMLLLVLGVLFLFVSNGILVGWNDVWPLLLIIGGTLFMRVYRRKPSPELMFSGVTSILLGIVLFLFTAGFVGWEAMDKMWPAVPLAAGIGLVASSLAREQGAGTMMIGLGVIVFCILALIYEAGKINPRVAGPIVRFWPLVLIIAGGILYRRGMTEDRPADPMGGVGGDSFGGGTPQRSDRDADRTPVPPVSDMASAGPSGASVGAVADFSAAPPRSKAPPPPQSEPTSPPEATPKPAASPPRPSIGDTAAPVSPQPTTPPKQTPPVTSTEPPPATSASTQAAFPSPFVPKTTPAATPAPAAPKPMPVDDDPVVAKVNAADGPDDAVRELVTGLKRRFLKYSWVGVYRYDDDVLQLGENDYAGAEPEYKHIKLDEGICGAAASTRSSIIVPDVCADPRYLACSPTVKSEIVVPILHENRLIGVLDIDSDQPDAFSADDRKYLETVLRKTSDRLAR